MKRVITAQIVAAQFEAGCRCIVAPRNLAIITPDAWSKGRELGVTFEQTAAREDPAPAPAREAAPQQGSCERVVDPSGLVVVRGRSVRLGNFAAAGANRHVGVADLVTGADGSPMTAGIMSWARDDSFEWTLDYDEIDLVLEGVLQIRIDGRTLEGRPGDVFYIPKGSRIVFGTPGRTRVFYVTYPADWAASANAPVRPQK